VAAQVLYNIANFASIGVIAFLGAKIRRVSQAFHPCFTPIARYLGRTQNAFQDGCEPLEGIGGSANLENPSLFAIVYGADTEVPHPGHLVL
jgi:hypothetical protein